MKRDLTISSIVRRYRKMHPIKYIKLSTGEDIVAQVDMKTLKNGELIVVNPQKVSIIEQVGFLSMALVKWIPWEDGQRIPINKRHVITVSNCQPVMHDYYHKTEAKIRNFKRTGDPQDDSLMRLCMNLMIKIRILFINYILPFPAWLHSQLYKKNQKSQRLT